MSAKYLRAKNFADILIFVLFLMGALVVLLVALGSAQTAGNIWAAPGQGVLEDITFGEVGDISITLPTFPSLVLNPENSHLDIDSIDPLVVDLSNIRGCSWRISVSVDTNGGCLAEYDPSAPPQYVSGGKKLQNPMWISAESVAGGNKVDLSKGGVLIEETCPSGGCSDAIIPLTVSQDVTWQDEPLNNDHVYHMEISFIASLVQCG
jgi:hypothetical protein